MSSDTNYESFLRDRWFAISQDAARAEALLELLLEHNDSPDCRIPKHLRSAINKFLDGRKERRKAAQARLDALQAERDAKDKGQPPFPMRDEECHTLNLEVDGEPVKVKVPK